MKPWMVLPIILFLLSGAGCDDLRHAVNRLLYKQPDAVPEKRSIEVVDSTELAKMLLKPETHKISVNRDPFKPLVDSAMQQAGQAAAPAAEPKELTDQEILQGIDFQGVVKLGGVYSALITTELGKGVYKVKDEVKGLLITDISDKYVTFKKDERVLKLKRGEQ